MSIIQSIRDKGAVIVIAVIAISLIGFILMDSMSGTGKLFGGGGSQTLMGVVNGEDIDYQDFNDKVTELEQQYGNQGAQRSMVMQGAWDQMVAEKVVDGQFQKLGLVFTPKELSSIIFSEDAPPQLKQAFTDKTTGKYDIEQAKQWWAQVKQNKNQDQRNALVSQVINPMMLSSLYAKYTSLISGSLYQPTWQKTMEKNENSQYAVINYVAVPYASINDSTIKITDKEIQNYIDAHKNAFKQEAGMMLSYVSFSASPSKADSQNVYDALTKLKPQFETDSNAKFFLGKNSSVIPFFDGYVPSSKMQIPNKEEITNLPMGGVFGPYLDGKNYVLAKKLQVKTLPDSFKVRHILIGTFDPQTQQETMADSTAKRIADSVATAIKNGASFDALEEKYSTDQGARATKGVMNFDLQTVQSDNFAKEFADFLLNEKGETKGVVKTQFGYHYIEIMEKKDFEPMYKIAYMAREIDPSDATINKANSEAVKLSAAGTNPKTVNDYISKNGLARIDLPTLVRENDYQLGSYPDARNAIRWANDAKEGSVSEPFSLGNDFVVVIVDKRFREGTADVQTARPEVEPILRNQKKAEQIEKKINNPASLETVAQAFNVQVLTAGEDSMLTFNSQIINGIGNEPKVAGASFNKDYQQKLSPAIPGNTGVFVIKVNTVGQKTISEDLLKQQQQMLQNRLMQSTLQQSFMGLRNMAKIKDYRSKFF